jgi:hypothetical protein
VTVPPNSCDDTNLCTTDACINDVDPGTACCSHAPVVCPETDCFSAGCDPLLGCTSVADCHSGPDCCPEDAFACTTIACNEAGDECVCTPDDLLCDDLNPCTDDACECGVGCVFTPNDGNVCDDGFYCNGTETCVGSVCQPGTPPCVDSNPCTEDTCDEAADVCMFECPQPDITCPSDRTFECDAVGDFGVPTVDDPCDPSATGNCTDEVTPGKLPQERIIVRTCTVINRCGNSDSCMQTIEITDNTPPEITCPEDVDFECDAVGPFGDPIVSDNCDPEPDVTVDVETIVNDCTTQTAGVTPPPKLSITRTITALDGTATSVATGGGPNSAVCVQHIDIFDTTPPLVVGCPTEIVVCPDDELNFTPPTCTDACGPCTVTCVRGDGRPLDAPVDLPTTISCTAVDECDNDSVACEVVVRFGDDCAKIIPTVSEWGLVVLTLLLLIGAKIHFGLRPQAELA